jgi:hypothetical protein
MTEKTLKQKLISFDNKITFVVGYRNLYTFVVAAIGVMCLYYGEQLGTPYYYMLAMILFVLAGKWFLEQVRVNIDELDVVETLVTKE